MLRCGNLQKQDVASSKISFFLGYMDTSPHSRRDLPLFHLRIKRFQHLCNANRAETQLLVRRSCTSSGRLRCRQMSKGKVAQNPLNQRAEELEDVDKREKEAEFKLVKGRKNGRKGNIKRRPNSSACCPPIC